ncbi:MAG: HAMP domain-containing sensor histidine kinase [Flavobacteriales bacterium]
MIGFVEDYRKLSNVPAPRKQWFKLEYAVKSQLELVTDQLKGIEVTLQGETDLQVHADQAQCEQVILNVLLNAIYALEGKQCPKIEIALEKKVQNTWLHISDNGKGIAPEDLNQVFIPFYTTREKGSGIGLSLSRQIMRNHGGSIALESKKGEGTKVSLRFNDH